MCVGKTPSGVEKELCSCPALLSRMGEKKQTTDSEDNEFRYLHFFVF